MISKNLQSSLWIGLTYLVNLFLLKTFIHNWSDFIWIAAGEIAYTMTVMFLAWQSLHDDIQEAIINERERIKAVLTESFMKQGDK